MNYFQAKQLLDEVRDGVDHSYELITRALYTTGDINHAYKYI